MQWHHTGKYPLHSLSSSLISTYPSKINSSSFNSSLGKLFPSISSRASSQTYTANNLVVFDLNLFEDLVIRAKSSIDCTFTLVKITVFNMITFTLVLVLVSKWIQIYCITHQLTSLNNIFSYLMRKLQSLTNTCQFNNIISTFCIYFGCITFSIIIVAYNFSSV